jgi:hypothetical protein
MIFGYQKKATVIAAQNLLGYDNFITSDFSKEFIQGENLEFLYPPDHELAGTKYAHDYMGAASTVFGTYIIEESREGREFQENSSLNVNKDFVYPYQTNLQIQYHSSVNSGLRPITDRGVTADLGVDSFIIKGSIISGVSSGAKRFYSGPFKGFTKEIECVCEGATSVNLMDGTDCKGNLKGSYYEEGYSPYKQDIFKYAGEPRMRVDFAQPFSTTFMEGTPYEGLDYTWLNIRDRSKRPIPYSMFTDSGKGVSAVLISPKHAIVSVESDIDVSNLKFYSSESGLTTATVATSVSTFKQMWDAIGFVSENTSPAVLEKYEELSSYFDDIKVITFAQALPDDISPIGIIDINTTDPIFFGLAISHEARGHHGIFCPPLNKTEFDPSILPRLTFKQTNYCPQIPSSASHELSGTDGTERTVAVVRGDVGSPVITYYRDVPVFLGLVSGAGYTYYSNPLSNTSFALLRGMGIGSSKEIVFPWGQSWSPLAFLNAYLALVGESVTSIVPIRAESDTNLSYPYPSVSFGTVTPKSTSRRASLVNTDPRIGVKFSESGIERFTNRPYLISERNDEVGTTVSVDFTS